MAYYITKPDLLLVEFQLGMMRPIPVPNILLMNLYNQLMLCAKISIFFLKKERLYLKPEAHINKKYANKWEI